MSESKHTPGEWYASPLTDTGDWSLRANGLLVAEVVGCSGEDATDEANAAFIVRACNAHDDLLAALTSARSYVAAMAFDSKDPLDTRVLARIDAAIARARGEQVSA